MARREPDYKFVLAEVDYLKPYWDTHPEDRADLRRFIADGRVEVMGGTYNEPNTNLTSPETTIRNFVHGIGFQRDVLGADPATAWQLDVFGHDPQFPGMAADAGLTSSSWARGPHHQWGPMAGERRSRAHAVLQRVRMDRAERARAAHPLHARALRGGLVDGLVGDAGGGRGRDLRAVRDAEDGGADPQRAAAGRHRLHAAEQVGHRDPPRLERALHLAEVRVRAAQRVLRRRARPNCHERGVEASPQTRDMNPIYTGCHVSYIDTKQANRAAEDAVLDAEKFAVFAGLLGGATYPQAALAKAWVQLAYGAHHDAITGSESDQVYLDLLTGWRDAWDLGTHDPRQRAGAAVQCGRRHRWWCGMRWRTSALTS